MLSRLARIAIRRSRAVLVAAALFAVAAGALGGGVAANLVSGGFEDPASDSSRAEDLLAEQFDSGVPNLVLVVTAPDGTDVDDPEVAAAGQALTAELAAEDHVDDVVGYWSDGGAPPLRSEDGVRALVVARIEGTDDEVDERVEHLAADYRRTADGARGAASDGDGNDGITVDVGGFAPVFNEIGTTIRVRSSARTRLV